MAVGSSQVRQCCCLPLVNLTQSCGGLQKHEKEVAAETEWRTHHSKELRKKRYIMEGQAEKRNSKRARHRED